MIDKNIVLAALRCRTNDYAPDCDGCVYQEALGTNCCNLDQLCSDAMALLTDSVPQAVVSQIRWERDTALDQLKEIGKGLGSRMDDIVIMMRGSREETNPFPSIECNPVWQTYRCVCGAKISHGDRYCHECGRAVKWRG